MIGGTHENGLWVEGDGNLVSNNQSALNGLDGIHVMGSGNWIMHNHVFQNGQTGINERGGIDNLIEGNHAIGNHMGIDCELHFYKNVARNNPPRTACHDAGVSRFPLGTSHPSAAREDMMARSSG